MPALRAGRGGRLRRALAYGSRVAGDAPISALGMRLQRPPRFRRVCRRPSDSHHLPTPTHWLPLGGHRHSVPRERASRTPGLEVAKKVQDNIKNHPVQICGFRRPCAPLRAASLLARGVCAVVRPGVCALRGAGRLRCGRSCAPAHRRCWCWCCRGSAPAPRRHRSSALCSPRFSGAPPK